MIPFCVDNLPISKATLGVWSSLVRLAGTGRSHGTGNTDEYMLPKPPVDGETDIIRISPVRPLKSLDPATGELVVLKDYGVVWCVVLSFVVLCCGVLCCVVLL